MQEKWKKIDEFPKYLISNKGKIKEIDTGRILRQGMTRGYRMVSLRNDKGYFRRAVHRLVALAFVNGGSSELIVIPKDGNKGHVSPSNLKWITQKENGQRAAKMVERRLFRRWRVMPDGSFREIKRR